MTAGCGGTSGAEDPHETSHCPDLGIVQSRPETDDLSALLLADALEPPVLETPVSRHTSSRMTPIRPPPGLPRPEPARPVSIASELAEHVPAPQKVAPLTPEPAETFLNHPQQQPLLLQLHLHLHSPGSPPRPAALTHPAWAEAPEAHGPATADSTASEDSWQQQSEEQPSQPPLPRALKPGGVSPAKRATLVLVYFPRAATESDICHVLDHAIAQYGGMHLIAQASCVRECRIVRDKGLYGIFEFQSEELAKIILGACSRGNVVMKDALHKRWYLHASRSRRITVDVHQVADSGRTRRGARALGQRRSRQGDARAASNASAGAAGGG